MTCKYTIQREEIVHSRTMIVQDVNEATKDAEKEHSNCYGGKWK